MNETKGQVLDRRYMFSVPVRSELTPKVLSPVVTLAPVAKVIGFEVFETRCLIPVTPCASRAAMEPRGSAAPLSEMRSTAKVFWPGIAHGSTLLLSLLLKVAPCDVDVVCGGAERA